MIQELTHDGQQVGVGALDILIGMKFKTYVPANYDLDEGIDLI